MRFTDCVETNTEMNTKNEKLRVSERTEPSKQDLSEFHGSAECKRLEARHTLIATGSAFVCRQMSPFGRHGISNAYTPELARDYSSLREKFDETDQGLFNALKAVGVEGKEVLDFGCGDGRYSLLLKEMGTNHVTGLDVSQKMIDLAKKKAKREIGVDFIVADGMQVPLESERVDLILSNFVVHYFSDSEALLKELSRILKINGIFIGTFNVSDVDRGFEYLYNTNMPIRLGHGTESLVVHNLIKSGPEIHQALRDAGFVTEEEKELEHPNARIDDSYRYKKHVHKNAVLLVLRKRK
jgi:ubiquinone/menaquinone biosynthesis C-methylase UbiE